MNKICLLFFCSLLFACTGKYSLNGFSSGRENGANASLIVNDWQFNGYTTHWQDIYQRRYRYGNLFRLNITDAEAAVRQAKADAAEALGIPGLRMEEGFVNAFLTEAGDCQSLENPTLEALIDAVSRGNVLVFADEASETGKILLKKSAGLFRKDPANRQARAKDFTALDAFCLKNGNRFLFTVTGSDPEQLTYFRSVLENTRKLLSEYDLKRGWFGAQTLIKSVTCTPGTPVDVIGKGLNEGNSWFVFDGYMEFLAREEIEAWAEESNLPIVVDAGFSPIYNCTDYDGLQVQLMFTPQDWIDYAQKKNGYVFRQVYDRDAGHLPYDGYFANAGNARQINGEDRPFVIQTGDLLGGAASSMFLFHRKDAVFDRNQLWKAIMERRAVAVAEGGCIMGNARYRNAMQLLFLDKEYLEEYFGDRINMETETQGNRIVLTVSNLYDRPVEGRLKITVPEQLDFPGEKELKIHLPAGASKVLNLDVRPKAEAMNRRNVIAFTFDRGGVSSKSTVALLELPPAISVHELLYGTSSGIKFPVSVHNFTDLDSFPVKISIAELTEPSKPVQEAEHHIRVAAGEFCDTEFDVHLPAGKYIVTASTLGLEAKTQLGIEAASGKATVTETDLDGDGIMEYVMENGHVKATLLAIGARVIEYTVKAKNDNVLFKLWPEKPGDDRRPYRERGFYPYGGFEDFLGQPSIETHKVYDAAVIKPEGGYVQVKMTADYFGNVIEKVYSLYGDSPLLEVRFAVKMINPELNVIGPQPIYEVGKSHGPEDVFVIPEKSGLQEYRMRTDRYYGKKLDLAEGWNAAYDTGEDIAFINAYPVARPLFLHLWMNHPSNPDAGYFYAEFQPWTPLFMRTTSYFSCYMWADAGTWQKALDALRKRNLITKNK
ncbi:MAG: hypothetical protein LBL07_07350 [Tannerella sp.]|jgi:hypothetical protein|nr:hypothetical protein [Tannerella sp.]